MDKNEARDGTKSDPSAAGGARRKVSRTDIVASVALCAMTLVLVVALALAVSALQGGSRVATVDPTGKAVDSVTTGSVAKPWPKD